MLNLTNSKFSEEVFKQKEIEEAMTLLEARGFEVIDKSSKFRAGAANPSKTSSVTVFGEMQVITGARREMQKRQTKMA